MSKTFTKLTRPAMRKLAAGDKLNETKPAENKPADAKPADTKPDNAAKDTAKPETPKADAPKADAGVGGSRQEGHRDPVATVQANAGEARRSFQCLLLCHLGKLASPPPAWQAAENASQPAGASLFLATPQSREACVLQASRGRGAATLSPVVNCFSDAFDWKRAAPKLRRASENRRRPPETAAPALWVPPTRPFPGALRRASD